MKNYFYWCIEAFCPSFMIDHYALHTLPSGDAPPLWCFSWMIHQGLFWSWVLSQWCLSISKLWPCINNGHSLMFLTLRLSKQLVSQRHYTTIPFQFEQYAFLIEQYHFHSDLYPWHVGQDTGEWSYGWMDGWTERELELLSFAKLWTAFAKQKSMLCI